MGAAYDASSTPVVDTGMLAGGEQSSFVGLTQMTEIGTVNVCCAELAPENSPRPKKTAKTRCARIDSPLESRCRTDCRREYLRSATPEPPSPTIRKPLTQQRSGCACRPLKMGRLLVTGTVGCCIAAGGRKRCSA